jgi:hypothetical protein
MSPDKNLDFIFPKFLNKYFRKHFFFHELLKINIKIVVVIIIIINNNEVEINLITIVNLVDNDNKE